MPIYNGEKYLCQSMDSILNQSYVNFELLCINDCSNDSTGIILEHYNQRDKRIRIFYNEKRSGAAVSRNKGITFSNGKYLIFLDADDIFENDMLEVAYRYIEKHNADVVEFSCDSFVGDDYQECNVIRKKNTVMSFYGKVISILDYPSHIIEWLTMSVWNKLYLKEYIINNEIEFQDIECYNDSYFVFLSLVLTDKYLRINTNKCFLHYRQHNTKDRISTYRNPMCSYQLINKTQDTLIDKGYWNKLYNHFYLLMLFVIISALKGCKSCEDEKKFYDILQKKGINEIFTRGNITYRKIEPYIESRIKKFMTEPYSSRWWETETYLTALLYDYPELISKIIKDIKKKNKRIAIWGYGNDGKILLDFCHNHFIEIDGIIDRDVNKQGQIINDTRIMSIEKGCEMTSIIIVSNSNHYQDVKNALNKIPKKIKVFDIKTCIFEKILRLVRKRNVEVV